MEQRVNSVNITLSGKTKFITLIAACSAIIVLVITLSLTTPNQIFQRFSPVKLEEYDVQKPFVVKQHLDSVKILTPEERDIIWQGFIGRDWSNAETDRKKWSAYGTLYSSFRARYNVSNDQEILLEMESLEGFMAKTWPDFYEPAVRGGKFLRN